jgi:tRNA (guanine26-N2/guanine27-N2)-dimethyltransferase
MENISDNSPARQLLSKEPKYSTQLLDRNGDNYSPLSIRSEANFAHHPQSISSSSKVKLVRYQQNPTPHWGPGTKAESGTGAKRKRGREGEDE